ncbi:hypothetical protein EJ05DRAFT_43084 [Pseudovirgaria hyperparasitica]|uniref:Uncharacterized protein n=1 Tax=Pseudovirgaria hyperparasitica TaxID=470096 RepID=A0A6A6WN52_9PEZI|nr:uncharacterized protein EJ05DRAFT_43084 [Pseudovirgaria hyperparasitica]KAF2763563.1 hypothetical protein EJ05DRAFT_43084 [Pseudovirgaria hyperparasitica]
MISDRLTIYTSMLTSISKIPIHIGCICFFTYVANCVVFSSYFCSVIYFDHLHVLRYVLIQ